MTSFETDAVSASAAPSRVLGKGAALALVVGNVVGMGIFLTASEIAQVSSGPGVYLAFWVVGAIVAFAGAQAVAELATLFPVAGGDYVYLERAYGTPLAFSWGWLSFVGAFCGSIATLASGAAETLAASSWGSGLTLTQWTVGPISVSGTQLFAICLIALVTWVNFRGLKVAATIQHALTWGPLAIFVAMAVALIVGAQVPTTVADISAASAAPPLAGPLTFAGLGGAFSAIFFTYSGWNVVIYVAGEVKEPSRTLPWAMGAGVAVVALLYLGINVAFLQAMSLPEMASTRNVGVLAVSRLFGAEGGDLFAIVIFTAILSSLNSTSLGGSRVWKTMADAGQFWSRASAVHPNTGAPHVSLLTQAVFSVALVLSGDFGFLLSFTGAAMMLLSCFTVGALFVFRRRHGAVAPYRSVGYPFVPLLFLFSMLAALVVGIAADGLPYAVGVAVLVVLVAYRGWRS